jgi:hypothetical protein
MNWKTTKEDLNWIVGIAHRASAIADEQGGSYPYREAMMDITAVHANGCPLRLKELFSAPAFDFTHDIAGIRRCLNRETGQLEHCFVPRYREARP